MNAPRNGNGTDPVTVAEMAVLASAVDSLDSARAALAARLEPRHFSTPARRAIFAAVTRLATAPEPVIDPTAVLAELAAHRPLDGNDPDPAAVLAALSGRAGPVRHHAPAVLAAWQHRNLRRAVAEAAALIDAPGWDPGVSPARVRALVGDAASVTGPGRLRAPSEILDAVLGSLEHGTNPAVSTGYAELDDLTGGLPPGAQIVIGARTGVGKTLLALCIAGYVATELELPVLYTSLEMSERMLTLRRISSAAQVPLRKLTRWQVEEHDWDKIAQAYGNLASTQLYIDDATPAGLEQVRARLLEMATEGYPARLQILDYIGITRPPPAPSRQEAVSALARGHRDIARELDIPVITLAQINRGPEGRKDPTPLLSDLRESGDIENTADIVLLLHRENGSRDLRVIAAKNRFGETGEVTLTFQGHYGRITGSGERLWTPHDVSGTLPADDIDAARYGN